MEQRRLPLPEAHRRLLTPACPNRSLLLDRGFDRYNAVWRRQEADKRGRVREGRADFLFDFVRGFNSGPGYPEFMTRRKRALETIGAKGVPAKSSSRLVIGLGLPNPTDTGFLLDRLTGSPYLPGSSVKGLLRAAADLARNGEFQGESVAPDWKPAGLIDRIFGPASDNPEGLAKGTVVFYDAFPDKWPALEVDILTPHHHDYYENGSAPGDWESPTPVPFLTVQAGVKFTFFFRALGSEDLGPIKRLLPVALDWLGIGGKKSSGYGMFSRDVAAAPEVSLSGKRT